MGIEKNHFRKEFEKMKVNVKVFGATIQMDPTNIGAKLDHAQDVLDAQVWSDVQRYMPHDTGHLIDMTNMLNQSTRGEVYIYPPELDYGHYQHEGILYVDPVTEKGAFYSPEYGFWSRPGVEKVKSERKLSYSSPDAIDHWGKYAYDNHKEQWIRVAKNALKQG